jgi:hypothetical protein
MDCSQARQILIAAIRLQPASDEDIEAAIQHVAACAACQPGLQALARAVIAEELPCAEISARLLDYQAGLERGEQVALSQPEVYHHLQRCPACQAELAALQQILVSAQKEPLPPAAEGAQFDLSFLRSSRHLWQPVTAEVRRLLHPIRLLVSRELTQADQLAPPLQVLQPAPAYAMRAAEETPALLTIPDDEHGLRIHLGAGDTAEYLLELVVVVESVRSQPETAAVMVSLRDEEGILLERQHAAYGQLVIFRQVTAGHYRVSVEIETQRWEIDVPVRPAGEASNG